MNKFWWSDEDYVREYIKEKDYKIETDLENLVDMLLLHYEGELYDNNKEYYAFKDKRVYPENLMIDIKDLDAYVYDMGGLREFDYYS